MNDQTAWRACDIIRDIPRNGSHEVIIREKKSKRSLEQNALHWMRLEFLKKHLEDAYGHIYSVEEIHDHFKAKFLPVRMVEIGGEVVKVTRTTTKLSVKEMAEFMEKIDRYAADRLGVYLPTPGLEDMP